ncbi:hypothetical protein SAY87_004726 [Trapa incisa]|uniref:X8 domain-containing protein n=1 Tax=Trapa incisa TaxID=236973 RepID=A0AAN7JPC5_9MYRT|nr:hypothetical protein SAY87_004726 [Trapa incisa]
MPYLQTCNIISVNTMAKTAALPILTMLFFLLFVSGGIIEVVNAQKTWCVAKPSSDLPTLLANVNYACSQVDCSILQKGCPCFYPDNLMNHASIAMNMYYQAMGRNGWNCDFKNSGLIVFTDPSKTRDINHTSLFISLTLQNQIMFPCLV